MARKSLEQQFHEAETAAVEAVRTLENVRASYFEDRRRRLRAGEDVEALACLDSGVWSEQLARESIVRKNTAEDRRAGLAA